MNYPKPERIISEKAVLARTSLSRSDMRRRIKVGTFPAQIKLSPGPRVGWRESEVEAWIARLTAQLSPAVKAA